MWDKRAQVLSNHDGDTVTLILDQGFGDTKKINLRLDAVYAPELNQVGGPETREFVRAWCADRSMPLVTWPFVTITRMNRAVTAEQSTLGRYVGTVMCGQESLNAAINAFLHERGYVGGIGS